MRERKLAETDYVLGATDPEIERLGVQHAIWRERALAAWRRAGLKPGMTVLDMGSGPGHASFDLAALVGPEGRVIAVDQSPLFLDALADGARARGLSNVETVQSDLARLDLGDRHVDVIWSRWVLSFTPDPRGILARVVQALRPGGLFIAHEYANYSDFTIEPHDPVFDRFIEAVGASWRAFGGDPDIGLKFPAMLAELGLEALSYTPHMFATRPTDMSWRWPIAWLKGGAIGRLVELGFLPAADAETFENWLDERAADPQTLMITPMVLECIARVPATRP